MFEFYKNIDFKEEKINGRQFQFPIDWINKLTKDIFEESGAGGDIKKEHFMLTDEVWRKLVSDTKVVLHYNCAEKLHGRPFSKNELVLGLV
jgi:hypothetical protein